MASSVSSMETTERIGTVEQRIRYRAFTLGWRASSRGHLWTVLDIKTGKPVRGVRQGLTLAEADDLLADKLGKPRK